MREVGKKRIGSYQVAVRVFLTRHTAGQPIGEDDRYSFAFDVTRDPSPNRNGVGYRTFVDRTAREFTTEEAAAEAAFQFAEEVINGDHQPLLTVADM